MGNRIHGRKDDAVPAADAGMRARGRVGVASSRRLAQRIVDRGRRARNWMRALLLCKAALLAAALMLE